MKKDFDKWNFLKKDINNNNRTPYFHSREIWWCSLGLNIGEEIDGKNNNFERPVLIIKVYNRKTLLILPLTSKNKNDKYHFNIESKQKTVYAKITQMRVISSKRLLRKIGTIDKNVFLKLKQFLKESI